MLRRGLLALCLLLGACQRSSSEPAPAAPAPAAPATPVAHTAPPSPAAEAAKPDAATPAITALPVCRPEGTTPLEAARRYSKEGRFEEALSCAAQAAALDPDLAEAHAERGEALAALNRVPEAQMAFARALAVDPGSPEALIGAANLYAVQLPSTRERDELGLLYAERGLSQPGTPHLAAEFALVSSMAFNDLGMAEDALARAAVVLAREPNNLAATYERALALFELCRFAEAKAAFTLLLNDPEHGAHSHQHLGLLLEREGKWKEAQTHFDKARQLMPEDFPPPTLLSEDEFRAAVIRAVEALPEDMRKDLKGVPVMTEELPADADLMSGEPPLSPTILGLFRGPPLKEPCDGTETPCRSMVLYRRNLARAVRSQAELLEQIQVTLLHEVGHLRGEDDEELAARGLE